MADLSKLKRKGSLGAPPPITEASSNLAAPETAPAAPQEATFEAPARPAAPNAQAPGRSRPDARSARKTGRTVQFATRVSPEFDARVRDIAARQGLLLVEVLEQALDAYEKQ